MNPVAEKAKVVVEPPVEAAGYELVDLEWKHEPGGWILRAFIDKPGGVGHQDCERISREISAVLDVHDVIPHHYSLEVSSPGLNRPLTKREHFERFAGHKAKVRLKQGLDGRRNFSGQIVKCDDQTFTLNVDGKEFALPFNDLEKASLEYEFKRT